MKILFSGNLKEHYREQFNSAFPGVELVATPEEDELDREIADAEVYVSWGQYVSRDRIRKGRNLKWVHALTTGVDAFLIPEIINSDIILTNSRGIHGEQMSEHVFSFLLGFSRRQFDFAAKQQQKEWSNLRVNLISRRTLGIVGLGTVGEAIARKAKAFDMTVLASKNSPVESPYVDKVYPADGLHDMLPQLDYVVLLTPLTEDTRHLIGKTELSLMKESAFLINVARGEIVDDAALIEALREGTIAGAGLDVFSEEPLPEDSPYWELPNCYITPHVGGVSPDYKEKALGLLMESVKAYLRDEKLPTEVDKTKGY